MKYKAYTKYYYYFQEEAKCEWYQETGRMVFWTGKKITYW